ncbi:hypothetical protein C8E05_1571 [Rhodococcus wratislaviensis]|uniref:Uncharacterized protein n=1 Tax=Rhodococcus wratislaviensis TaxID=44752 RepID=A0AB38FH32_RHOWR|nr:hypothetical protein C8E05_1571 [Rhodococcus wratislaviensis]SPZ40801.1 Uncharacterised protein [Rhodococcus wratislaviensis]
MPRYVVDKGLRYCSTLCQLVDEELDRLEIQCQIPRLSPEDDAVLTEAWTTLVAAADAFSAYRAGAKDLRRVLTEEGQRAKRKRQRAKKRRKPTPLDVANRP